MPDFSKGPGGFGTGLQSKTKECSLVVLEEYGTGIDLLIKARNQPHNYLVDLLEHLRHKSNAVWRIHPDALDLYITQFDSPLPVTFAPVPPYSDPPAIHALSGLGFTLSENMPPYVIQTMGSAWPNIWKWLGPIYWKLILVEDDSYRLIYSSIRSALGTFARLLVDPSTTSTVIQTEGVLEFAMRIYVDLGKSPPTNDDDIYNRGRCSSMAL
ncbi:hypothetical protein DXG01_013047, partial [Tephrocybe rancida]